MLFDFSLDPIAMKQVFETAEGTIGRWTWFPGMGDVQIFGEPVYNYTGWILLCGLFTASILAGRAWYRKSGYKASVGTAYPILCSLGALIVLVSPISQFLIWLAPFFGKGSVGEWIMLGVNASAGIGFFALYVLPSRRAGPNPGRETPALLVLVAMPILNLLVCLASGFWDIAWLVDISALVLAGGVIWMLSIPRPAVGLPSGE